MSVLASVGLGIGCVSLKDGARRALSVAQSIEGGLEVPPKHVSCCAVVRKYPETDSGSSVHKGMKVRAPLSGAIPMRFVWAGLGTPKQERWMHDHRDQLGVPVLVGVGAAFDLHAGRLKQAPPGCARMPPSGSFVSFRSRAAYGAATRCSVQVSLLCHTGTPRIEKVSVMPLSTEIATQANS